MRRHISQVQASQLSSIDEVLECLQQLEHDLPRLGLAHLRNFNYTYLIITRNVGQAAQRGYFDDRAFLNTFDGRFAYYYVNALLRYVDGQAVPLAWRAAFGAAAEARCTSFVAMALGVNAHVNNDIPLVLRDCQATARLHADYCRVNDIIGDSLGEVIDELDAADNVADPKRGLLTPAYKLVMNRLVKDWRDSAWQSFEELGRQEVSVKEIEGAAHRMAERLLALPL
jgi:hypothetical protein